MSRQRKMILGAVARGIGSRRGRATSVMGNSAPLSGLSGNAVGRVLGKEERQPSRLHRQLALIGALDLFGY